MLVAALALQTVTVVSVSFPTLVARSRDCHCQPPYHQLKVLFLYLIVFLPWIRGIIPNVSPPRIPFNLPLIFVFPFITAETQYPSWQGSRRLRLIMPLLTSTILTGFIALVLALTRGTPLGAFRSILSGTSPRPRALPRESARFCR